MERLASWAGKLSSCLLSLNARANSSNFQQPPPAITQKFRNGFFRVALAMSLGILWVPAHAVTATAPIGATSGSFSVSPSGAATYSIPIFVPPGTNGMAPKLSLDYNSQGGNGLVGMGWSIGGLSVIHRCGATIAIDGFKGGVNYDANDKFCLDGERLIWDATGGFYHTQHESWQKIVFSGSATDPTSFTVTSKDGTIRFYGLTTIDARIEAQGKTVARIWALNKIQDTSGNYLTITYQEDNTNGDFRPARIDYTGNGAVATYNSVVFGYVEPQASRPDIVSLYEAGSAINTLKRLTNIYSYAGASLAHEYRFVYDPNGGAGGRSRLKSIQECGSDGACLPPTSFVWQSNQFYTPAALQSGQRFLGHPYGIPGWVIPFDYDGDGYQDLAIFNSSSDRGYTIAHNNGDGTFTKVAQGQSFLGFPYGSPQTTVTITAFDYNGDGKQDLLFVNSSGDAWYMIAKSNGDGTFTSVSSGQHFLGHPYGVPGWVIPFDFDGDGRQDVAIFNSSGDRWYTIGRSNGDGTFTKVAQGQSFLGFPYGSPQTTVTITAFDYNGDGKQDLLFVNSSGDAWYTIARSNGDGTFTGVSTGQHFLGHPYGVPGWVIPFDFNGDGLQDVAIFNSSGDRWYTIGRSNGDGTFTKVAQGQSFLGFPYGSPQSTFPIIAVDFNKDGKTDLAFFNNSPDRWYMFALSNGDGTFSSLATGQTFLGFPYGSPQSTAAIVPIDYNGNGRPELLFLNNSGDGWYQFAQVYNGAAPDLLSSITNGFGVQTAVTYKPLTDSTVYFPDTVAPYKCTSYPCQDVRDATYVVSQITQSDGNGGNNVSSITYDGLKTHLTAGSSLGFRWMQTTDPTGLLTKTTYNQITTANNSLNGIEGTVFSTETWSGNVRVKYIGDAWTPATLQTDAAGRIQRTTAQLTGAVEETRELDNSVVTTVSTSSSYDAYDNPLSILTTYSTGGVNDGYSKTTTNTYNNDPTNWILGQLTRSQVVSTAPGQPALTRTSAFGYDGLNRLTSEVIEPDRTDNLKLTTTYGYDAFGNRNSKSVTGSDIVTRTESQIFDPQGRFVTSKTNALNHTESYITDARYGAVTNLTGPNGIPTSWSYDGFGRKIGETRADGTTTTINYICWNGTVPTPPATCAAGTGYATQTYGSGAGDVWVYYDILGRPSRTARVSFANSWVYSFTTYDNLGRTISISKPDFSSTYPAANNTIFTYDDLGRVRIATAPGNRVTTTVYNGLTTTATFTAPNTQTQTKSTLKNSQGKVVSSTDAAGTTGFVYDAIGNLVQVTDPLGNLSTMTYNIRGFKTAMHDSDMGNWSYAYDALGQLKSQTDAKNQTTSMTYDKLGRMLTRVLPNGEGTSSWTYDTATKGIGKLASVSNPNANESYTYDSLGRPSTATTSISGVTYTVTTGYDTYSRVSTVAYPETGFTLRHCYDGYGFLNRIENAANATPCSSSLPAFWILSSVDAMNRALSETYGNGLIGTHAYDATTGDLTAIKTGISGNLTSVQNEAYGFDGVGNLLNRTWWDGTANRSETFGYDNLNRLKTVAGPVAKTYNYDTIGNITFKSDVGNYTYPASGSSSVRPHAVSATSGGAVTTSFTYDANGNMLTGNGKTVTYTSFNKAKTIQKGTTTDTLTYDASFNRLIKSNASGTTIYIGKLYERNTSGTTVTQKHYLYAGNNIVGLYSKVGTTISTRYFHTDNLGSVDIITNETGGVVQRLSYDAWGKRRNVNGTDAASITAQATRGFTAHEHDDEVTLINMNAREYDPIIARFISPDTLIPGALNSQAYNRYTYVNNNPLSYTDPTGHWSLRKAVQKIAHSVSNIVRADLQYMFRPSVRNAFNAVQAQPGMHYVDKTLMRDKWAREGLMFASSLCGPAAPACAAGAASYTTMLMGGSSTDAFRAGAAAWFSSAGSAEVDSWGTATWDGRVARVVGSGVVSGISSTIQGEKFSDGFLYSAGMESLKTSALAMRTAMVEQSKLDPEHNASGTSVGFRGDGFKLGGGRWVDGLGLSDQPISWLGGRQGDVGSLFGVAYAPGSLRDYVVEAFAGPHDYLNSGYWYLENGDAKNLIGFAAGFGEVLNYANVIVATPFVAASVIPQSVLLVQ